ncbi:restriction endonuclease subunit S [Aeromonas dhakensis]|uniref:restriction endonuclease subunit S n=1 Tax=Aeromonas dhakensis TaxID=196024 RepID=UPI002447FA9E|nr:restriction endonuclease subunit S [Aeromonas dhakensis]MDH0176091.1 restriction endonuclease subunit S [Aeromonas dhakensis]
MSWSEKSLDELGFVSRGRSKHRPRDAAHLYGGQYPFVQTGDVKHAGLYLTEYSQTYSEEGLAQSKLWPVGTLCITIAANIADTSILAIDACFPDSVIGFIPDPKKADVRFVKYLFDAVLKLRYRQFTQGAAQDNLSQAKLLALKFLVPDDVTEQTKIADFIAIYDELIENNRRRIQLLEESARLLYQEWFVHLRFPGHEQVKITDGVPEGWARLTVAECCQKPTYGYTASATHEAIGPKFLRITDIVPNSISWPDVPYCEADEATTKKYQLNEGDIVVARTGATVGYAKRMSLLSEPVIYASYLVKFSPNKSIVDDLLLGVFMESDQYKDFVRGNAGGAAQPNANAQILGGAKLLVPCEFLQNEFRSNVAPLMEQKFLLEKQNVLLAKARDLLLPKLMSGELTV